ncbi:calcium-translocating P-type ATPase, PMCA-type [Segatella bryantii]|uniref:P-type Ca(2+) transporter n=1 Tax=Segatella bryantii TaxID=77095 RepID=A0ABX4EI33_SEGBR|nr:calcium-translocating P-type ATPase, PMCA-type [Segatella bryantii]OYP55665.1 calcium-translocating P-type ATPase, PMCA-type [Segatella bryantii]UKK80884.1 calcium-translocating P-type ATPase, PMCA-type [Segatella bryantii]
MKKESYNPGLDDQQVADSRAKYGSNRLTPPRKTSLWMLYLDKYRDPIIQILLVAVAISLIMAFLENDFVETIGIFIAVILATTIGFYFERDAAKKFGLLTAMNDDQMVKVRRNDHVIEIARHEVVVGDVVLVEVGDEVPADGILLESTDLQIDESSLTGEPIINKDVLDETGDFGDATYPKNLLLRSTMVMNGRGVFEVVAVGDYTEIGKVAQKSTEETNTKTPLNVQLDKLASMISKIGSGVAVAAFLIFLVHDILTQSVWHSGDYLKMAEVVLGYFMMSVTLIVMAVPEGLPMAVTLALALNMRRMLKSNNLVRKLHACETMGAVTVICTDKTGTLTQNKMTVSDMVILHMKDKNVSETSELLNIGIALNTTANLDGDKGIGNPTEVALLSWLKTKQIDYRKIRQTIPVEHQVPFSTEKKYMETDVIWEGKTYQFIKGAPEIVIGMCEISDEMREKVETKLLEYQQKAMRTLAFAIGKELVAICGIFDPVREDVPEAVKRCQEAGIEVKIVTGDTTATAAEIGRQIGLFAADENSKDVRYSITGPEWAALSDEDAYQRATEIRIMSRARPTDKQRLVQMLQKRGEVVAVTGDGTNDAPALHYAHVGLSLGSGTSVAKSASDMTLLDDSFGSIANAVMWGRSLYKNIQRFLFFQLVVNLTALLLVLGGSLVGTEMPLTVTQILWVNLIMDTFAAMALASLPPSREVMKDRPRDRNDFIISPKMAKYILSWGLVFFVLMLTFLVYCEYHGAGVDIRELTMFFTVFVMLQFWNLFNAKSFGSHFSAFRRIYADQGLALVLCIILLGQWLIVTFGGKMFRTVPLTAMEWGIIIASTSLVMWIGEGIRLIQRYIDKK